MSTRKHLRDFLRARAGAAVVRVRDAAEDPDTLFSATFVSPDGHLLTAYHALESRLLDLSYRAEFDVTIEFDPAWTTDAPTEITCRAVCEVGWRDPVADLAVLKLDHRPAHHLVVAPARRSEQLLGRGLVAYGFTVTQRGVPAIGEIEGRYLRALTESRRFRMAGVVTGQGQSGGPVIDVESYRILGVVVGFLRHEINTGDAARVSREWFAERRVDIDFDELERIWRRDIATHLVEHNPQFVFLRSERRLPAHPRRYLRGRADVARVLERLRSGETGSVLLHGAPGSGKTSVALELTEELRRDTARPVFWHDFYPEENRSEHRLVRELAIFLLEYAGEYEVAESYPDDPNDRDDERAIADIAAALVACRPILVFDNVHFLYRDGLRDLVDAVEKLTEAATPHRLTVVQTSWDIPDSARVPTVVRLDGLAETDLAPFLAMYNVHVREVSAVVDAFRHDITCVELIVRRPEWITTKARTGELPDEPEEFHRYWLAKYRRRLPAAANRVLLAFAVLDEPAAAEFVEFVAEVDDFRLTLDMLRVSPPLVEMDATDAAAPTYDVHHNVRRAYRAISDRGEIARAHLRAGDYLAGIGRAPAAARHYIDAREIGRAIDILYERHGRITAAGDVEELDRMADELSSYAAEVPDGRFKVNVILGACHHIRSAFGRADRHWRFALGIAPTPLDTAAVHNARANTLRLAGDYERAREQYERALAIASDGAGEAMRGREAGATLGLAKLARLAGDYESARDYYEDAHSIFELMFDEVGMVETEFGLGEVTRLTLDLAAATDFYARSLARARRIGSTERVAYALWGVGETERLAGATTEAESAHVAGLELCLRVGDVRSQGWALLGMAETRRQAGDLDGASSAYTLAVGKFTETDSGTEIAHARLGIAELRRSRGEPEVTGYDAVEATYRRRNMRHALVYCLWSKALAMFDRDRATEARVVLAEALALAESIGLRAEVDALGRVDPSGQPGADARPLILNFP